MENPPQTDKQYCNEKYKKWFKTPVLITNKKTNKLNFGYKLAYKILKHIQSAETTIQGQELSEILGEPYDFIRWSCQQFGTLNIIASNPKASNNWEWSSENCAKDIRKDIEQLLEQPYDRVTAGLPYSPLED